MAIIWGGGRGTTPKPQTITKIKNGTTSNPQAPAQQTSNNEKTAYEMKDCLCKAYIGKRLVSKMYKVKVKMLVSWLCLTL